jgi:hypothetical protein
VNVSLEIARVLVAAFELYTGAGLGFALMFLARGVVRVDPRVAGAPLTLRLVILPGIVALWPLVALRWFTAAKRRAR